MKRQKQCLPFHYGHGTGMLWLDHGERHISLSAAVHVRAALACGNSDTAQQTGCVLSSTLVSLAFLTDISADKTGFPQVG